MGDIPTGWATLIAAAITSAGAIAAMIMSARTRSDVRQMGSDVAQTKSDAREVKEQVKNSHDTNMREEGDERHEAVMSELRTIKSTQATHGRQIRQLDKVQRGMKRDIGRLADADQEQVREDNRLGARLAQLEHPKQPPPQGES